VISSSQDLCLNTGQHKHRINIYTYQTSMSYVGFETTNPASERAKTVHVLDRSATVTGLHDVTYQKIIISELIYVSLKGHHYCRRYEIAEDEMVGACSIHVYRKDNKYIKKFRPTP
jgi:hypothetical protein